MGALDPKIHSSALPSSIDGQTPNLELEPYPNSSSSPAVQTPTSKVYDNSTAAMKVACETNVVPNEPNLKETQLSDPLSFGVWTTSSELREQVKRLALLELSNGAETKETHSSCASDATEKHGLRGMEPIDLLGVQEAVPNTPVVRKLHTTDNASSTKAPELDESQSFQDRGAKDARASTDINPEERPVSPSKGRRTSIFERIKSMPALSRASVLQRASTPESDLEPQVKSPQNSHMFYEAICDWIPETDSPEELAFRKGDRFEDVIKCSDKQGWWTAKRVQDGTIGLISPNFIRLTSDQAIIDSKGVVHLSSGAQFHQGGNICYPDGSFLDRTGWLHLSNGEIKENWANEISEGNEVLLDGSILSRDGKITFPSGAYINISASGLAELRSVEGNRICSKWQLSAVREKPMRVSPKKQISSQLKRGSVLITSALASFSHTSKTKFTPAVENQTSSLGSTTSNQDSDVVPFCLPDEFFDLGRGEIELKSGDIVPATALASGLIKLNAMYEDEQQRLVIQIEELRVNRNIKGAIYVKVYLLPDEQHKSKQKTQKLKQVYLNRSQPNTLNLFCLWVSIVRW